MNTSAFQKAVKRESKLLLALSGPSGSGKTYTALKFAAALGGRVAVIDTEHGSAAKYADLFDFDTMSMQPPYNPARFARGVEAARAAGYDILIIDSLTHAWAGTGGALEMVDEASKRFKGNSYMAWGEVTPIYRGMVDTIVGAGGAGGMHVIATMRSKTEYVLETNEKGKTVPRKVGMAPISRDGVEYEFDVWMEMTIENDGIVQKTRCPQLTGRVFNKPGEDVIAILNDWLGGAAPVANEPVAVDAPDQPTAPTVNVVNVNGAPKPEPEQRPLAPEAVREMLRRVAGNGSTDPGTGEDAQRTASSLAKMVGDDHRSVLLEWLFGVASTKDLTVGQHAAIKRWAGWQKDDNEEWHLNPDTVKEAQAALRQAQLDAGQGALFPEEDVNAVLGLGQ